MLVIGSKVESMEAVAGPASLVPIWKNVLAMHPEAMPRSTRNIRPFGDRFQHILPVASTSGKSSTAPIRESQAASFAGCISCRPLPPGSSGS